MDHPHLVATGERRRVDEGAERLARLLAGAATEVELGRRVRRRRGPDRDGRLRGVALRRRHGRAAVERAGTRTRSPPRPVTTASPFAISAIVPRTPSAGATTGSPGPSGAVTGSGLVELAQRPPRAGGALRRRTEPAVALALLRERLRRRRALAVALEARARRGSRRGAHRAPPGWRRARAPPRRRRARALRVQRRARARSRSRARRPAPPPAGASALPPLAPERRSRARPSRAPRPPPPRRAAPRRGVAQGRRARVPLRRARAGRPSCSAIRSACDVPGRPRAMR